MDNPVFAAAFPNTTVQSTQSKPDVTFFIYLKPDDPPIIDDFTKLTRSKPLLLIIHGFKGDHTARSMECIKQGKINI
ncbi:hypothetical protein J6590_040954 [Homalodisca vitripennis]|nr:hypothetical protein J6590_040954 [Homalodisca vitripennis]